MTISEVSFRLGQVVGIPPRHALSLIADMDQGCNEARYLRARKDAHMEHSILARPAAAIDCIKLASASTSLNVASSDFELEYSG